MADGADRKRKIAHGCVSILVMLLFCVLVAIWVDWRLGLSAIVLLVITLMVLSAGGYGRDEASRDPD